MSKPKIKIQIERLKDENDSQYHKRCRKFKTFMNKRFQGYNIETSEYFNMKKHLYEPNVICGENQISGWMDLITKLQGK